MASAPLRRSASLTLLLGLAVLVTALAAGCATSSDAADAQRRRDLVVVPPNSQAVDSLRWSRVRSIKPVNNRMILIEAGRPYLLVLSTPCRGLQPNSVVVSENVGAKFQPRIDTLIFVDPFSSAGFNAGTGSLDNIGIVNPSARTGTLVGRGGVVCQPETLYALESSESVDQVRQAVSRKKEK
ncbi:MAG: DUF6491 family protein [Pseudomonadota bacterium]